MKFQVSDDQLHLENQIYIIQLCEKQIFICFCHWNNDDCFGFYACLRYAMSRESYIGISNLRISYSQMQVRLLS